MNKYFTKLLIWLAIPALGFAAGNIKTQGDGANGSLSSLSEDDLIYVLQSPYGAGDDAYITGLNLTKLGGKEPVYNALTDPDSTISLDYVDRLNPGTDLRIDLMNWLEVNGIREGKRRFYLPAGHYQMSQQSGDTTGIDIQSNDGSTVRGVEIFGDGIGKTIIFYPQDYVINQQYKPMIRIGWQYPTYDTYIHDITFAMDPYMTEDVADGTARFGWTHIPIWTAGEAVSLGDRRVSIADDFIIEYQEDATCAGTEPTWSAGSMTDNGSDVVVAVLANWAPATAYSEGQHAKFVRSATNSNLHPISGSNYRSIARCTSAGTSGGSTAPDDEPYLIRPSSDGAGANFGTSCISNSYYAHNTKIDRCEFVGMGDFNEAGGTGIGMTNSGDDGITITNCIFRDFNYGTGVAGYGNGMKLMYNQFYRTGGWGFQYGTFNAHCMYLQGGNHLIAFNNFDSHYYGIDVKIHNNASNQDLIGTRIIGNHHLNYGWNAVEIVDPDTYTVSSNPDFIPQATSGTYWTALMTQSFLIEGCHFRIEKEVYDDWNGYGGHPGAGHAISSGTSGTVVSNCTFVDTHGIRAYAEDTVQDYDNTTVTIMATNCSFRTIFRKPQVMTGAVRWTNSEFDFRAIDMSGMNSAITMDAYSSFQDCRFYAINVSDTDRYTQFLDIDGQHATVENCFFSIEGTGNLGFTSTNASGVFATFRNNKIIAPLADMYWYPAAGTLDEWLYEGNYWDIASWAYCRSIGTGCTFSNERGNLWGQDTNAPTGDVVTYATTVYRSNDGYLVDIDGAKATTDAGIYGVAVKNSDNAGTYTTFVAISERSYQWITTSAQVTLGDWVILSGTAGAVAPNGTTGSTTKPTTGFIGLVRDVGTAGAGAGIAQVEIFNWNK